MYKTIISSKNLKDIINDKNLIIFDCRYNLMEKDSGFKSYIESHIKNAHYINLELDLSSNITKHSGRHPLPSILKFSSILNSFGVNSNSQIVVYDDENSSMCSRMWWMLKLVGIENCAVLDGGFQSWLASKLEIDSEIPLKVKQENIEYSYNNNYIVETEELKILLEKKDIHLVDARDKDRFEGKIEPIDNKAGHIPGAINLPFKNNLEKNGQFKKVSELKEIFNDITKDTSKSIVNMCGSGVTACHNLLAMEHCGIKYSRIYVGSWSAWSSYDDTNINIGVTIENEN